MRPVGPVERPLTACSCKLSAPGLKISYDCWENLPLVNIDSSRMEQVLVN